MRQMYLLFPTTDLEPGEGARLSVSEELAGTTVHVENPHETVDARIHIIMFHWDSQTTAGQIIACPSAFLVTEKRRKR